MELEDAGAMPRAQPEAQMRIDDVNEAIDTAAITDFDDPRRFNLSRNNPVEPPGNTRKTRNSEERASGCFRWDKTEPEQHLRFVCFEYLVVRSN